MIPIKFKKRSKNEDRDREKTTPIRVGAALQPQVAKKVHFKWLFSDVGYAIIINKKRITRRHRIKGANIWVWKRIC